VFFENRFLNRGPGHDSKNQVRRPFWHVVSRFLVRFWHIVYNLYHQSWHAVSRFITRAGTLFPGFTRDGFAISVHVYWGSNDIRSVLRNVATPHRRSLGVFRTTSKEARATSFMRSEFSGSGPVMDPDGPRARKPEFGRSGIRAGDGPDGAEGSKTGIWSNRLGGPTGPDPENSDLVKSLAIGPLRNSLFGLPPASRPASCLAPCAASGRSTRFGIGPSCSLLGPYSAAGRGPTAAGL
jgi:hypothetical protein